MASILVLNTYKAAMSLLMKIFIVRPQGVVVIQAALPSKKKHTEIMRPTILTITILRLLSLYCVVYLYTELIYQ